METQVPIAELTETLTPRSRSGDILHARTLVENYERLPPILVHRGTMAVIDGVHRIIAGRLRGEERVRVAFFDGSEFDAFVEAIRTNSTHGKPLSFAERKAAARKVLGLRPEWSDRSVAEICGISPQTVASVRGRATAEAGQLSTRVGRDGRHRSTDPRLVRLRVAELVTKNPGASSRALASMASTSQATVRDVRRRLQRGESPLPGRLREAAALATDSSSAPQQAAEDAALIASEDGPEFCGWFDRTRIAPGDLEQYADVVPMSRLYLIADEARARSRLWSRFGELVEARARQRSR